MLVCISQPYPNYFIPLPIWRAISVLSVHYTIVNTNFNASRAFSFFPFLLRAVVIRMSMWHAAYNVLHYTRPSLRFSAIFAFGTSSSFVQLAYLFSLLMVSTHSKLRLLFRTLALCWALSVLFILNFPSFAVLAVSSLKRSFVIVGRVGDFWPFLLLVFFFFGLFPAFVTCPYPQDRFTYGTRSLFNFFSSWPSPFADGTLPDASQAEWKQLPHVLEWRAFVKYGIPRMTLSVLFFFCLTLFPDPLVSSCAYNVTLCRAHHNANRLGSVSDATRYRTLKAVRPGLQLRNQPQNAGIIVIIRAAKEHKNYETRLLTRGPAHSNTSRVGTE